MNNTISKYKIHYTFFFIIITFHWKTQWTIISQTNCFDGSCGFNYCIFLSSFLPASVYNEFTSDRDCWMILFMLCGRVFIWFGRLEDAVVEKYPAVVLKVSQMSLWWKFKATGPGFKCFDRLLCTDTDKYILLFKFKLYQFSIIFYS